MKFLKASVALVGLIASLLYGASCVAGTLDMYRGAVVVHDKTERERDTTIVLSAPKRISNALEIERQEQVFGAVSSRIYELKNSAQLKEVFDYYLEGFSSGSTILFQCEKRACGSSNYWANTIFDEHKLYGRDSDQYYLAAVERGLGSDKWTMLYIVQNGLRKKYVYELTLVADNGVRSVKDGEDRGVWINGSALAEAEESAQNIEMIEDYLKSVSVSELYLVVYSDSGIKPTETHWAQLEGRAERKRQILKKQLGGINLPIGIKVLGPLHSDPSFEKLPVWYRLYAY
jgi:hypothetical protein